MDRPLSGRPPVRVRPGAPLSIWYGLTQQTLRTPQTPCAGKREAQGRAPQPTAVVLDARTVQSTPESGARAGYDGHKRRKGAKTHAAVDTLGHLPALVVTPASTDERTQVAALAARVQAVTGEAVELAWVDQGYTGDPPAAAAAQGIRLEVVKLPQAEHGFVLGRHLLRRPGGGPAHGEARLRAGRERAGHPGLGPAAQQRAVRGRQGRRPLADR